jgi:hypothetical protein
LNDTLKKTQAEIVDESTPQEMSTGKKAIGNGVYTSISSSSQTLRMNAENSAMLF